MLLGGLGSATECFGTLKMLQRFNDLVILEVISVVYGVAVFCLKKRRSA